LIQVFTANRVGVKVTPTSHYNDMQDSDPIALYTHVVKELSKKKIALVEVAETFTFDATNDSAREAFFASKEHKNIRAYLKPHFAGAYIANHGYDPEKANTVLQSKEADLVSFGVQFICNGDLVERCRENKPLRHLGNVKDMSKLWMVYFYMGGAEGYTDLSPYEA